MKTIKALVYLLLTLLTTFTLSEALVYGSSYCSQLINSIAENGLLISPQHFKILITAAAAGFVSAFLKSYSSAKFSLEIISIIKEAIVQRLLTMKMNILENQHTGEIMNQYINDSNSLEQYLTESFPKILTSCITILVIGKSFYQMNRLLIWEVGICCLVILLISFYTTKKLTDLAEGRKKRTDLLLTLSDDFLRGIMTGRSYNLFPIMQKKINEAADEILDNEYHRINISSYSWLLQTISEWFPAFCLIGILFLQAKETFHAGDVAYLILMMNRMFKPFSELPGLMNETGESLVSLRRIRKLLQAESEDGAVLPRHEDQPLIPDNPAQDESFAVELENLTFRYDSQPVLSELSFQIKMGEEAAIVGASGGGKSTIFKILCGFLPPEKGNYRLFGKDSSLLSLQEIRKNFSLVSQVPYLFPGTIYENVACGNPSASMEEVINACRQANIHQDIEKKELGYETIIGENGAGLSGGEKQRLSLARALLKNSPILLLDEPTAALDSPTEQSIRQTLNTLKGKKTMIMIAHRLSTVSQADKILVIQDGQMKESGNEEELIKQKGYYYRLKMAGKGELQ